MRKFISSFLSRNLFQKLGLWLLFSVLTFTLSANHGVILQYHHISSSTPASTSLSPEIFKQHLDALEEGGFTVMALPELISRVRANEPVKDKTVAITFDDGYKSVYDIAYPMLKQRGWPFTVFVVPGAIEKKQSHVMSWQQLVELSEYGAIIANHSYSHQHLLRKKEEETVKSWQQRVLYDIQKAGQIIKQHTGRKLKLFAWPYGEYSTPLSELLKNTGFIAVAQNSGAINKDSDFLALPRFTFNQAYGDIKDFILKAGSLPFVVKQVIPESRIIDGLTKPVVKLLIADKNYDLRQLSCYASGQGKVHTQNIGLEVTIRLNEIPAIGRSRINCTLPVANNRYRWFSRQLIRKETDGSWYEG